MSATLGHSAPQRYPGALRVSGTLSEDAMLATGTGAHMVLRLRLQPEHGLPYLATVDLGTDLADHMHAEMLLPHLRAGAVVSVAARALDLRTDRRRAALRLVDPQAVLILELPVVVVPEPSQPPPTPTAAAAAAES